MPFDVGRFIEDLPKRSSFDDMVAILWQCAGREEGARLLSQSGTMGKIANTLYWQLYKESETEYRPEFQNAENLAESICIGLAHFDLAPLGKRWRIAVLNYYVYRLHWMRPEQVNTLVDEALSADTGEWEEQFGKYRNALSQEGYWNEFVDGTVATMLSFMTLCEKTLAEAAETGGETDGRT
jgi:hypothetical protein